MSSSSSCGQNPLLPRRLLFYPEKTSHDSPAPAQTLHRTFQTKLDLSDSLLVYLRSFLEDGTHTHKRTSPPFSPLLVLILIDLSVSTLGCPEWMRNLPATMNKWKSHRPRAQVGLSTAHRQQVQIFWLALKTSLLVFAPRADQKPPVGDVCSFLTILSNSTVQQASRHDGNIVYEAKALPAKKTSLELITSL